MGMSHLNGPCASSDHPGSLSKQPLLCGSEQWREPGRNGTSLWGAVRAGPLNSSPGACLEKIARPCRPPGASLRPETGAAAASVMRATARGGIFYANEENHRGNRGRIRFVVRGALSAAQRVAKERLYAKQR